MTSTSTSVESGPEGGRHHVANACVDGGGCPAGCHRRPGSRSSRWEHVDIRERHGRGAPARLHVREDGRRADGALDRARRSRRAELRVDAAGDHFEVYWDGKKVVDAHDQTFAEAGKVGLWTKADSVTEFDDLTVAPLGASP